jgi:N utilization substance protein B
VGLLYAEDIGNSGIDKFVDEIFEEKKIRNKQKDFALSLYNGVEKNLEQIDTTIDEQLKEWDLQNIGNVERAILRLGTYELLFTELDSAVIMNEAIELAKKLCNDTGPKFINGVLDAVHKAKAS